MSDVRYGALSSARKSARIALGRVEVLALFPALVLIADWFGYENVAFVTALGLSCLLALALAVPDTAEGAATAPQSQDGKAGLIDALQQVSQTEGRDTVCLILNVDNWSSVVDNWGHDSAQEVAQRIEDRLRTALRANDRLSRLGDARLGIVLAGLPAARLTIRDTVAARLAEVVKEPLPLNGSTVRLTACIGHASIRRRAAGPAQATFKAAEAALTEATLQGPGTIRAYADGMGRARAAASELGVEVEDALHSGAIDAWFQPQISAETGALTGLETLARWDHPKHGQLGHAEIITALEKVGSMGLLGQTLLHRALKALAEFDARGAHIPSVSINLSLAEMQDPGLAGTLDAELDRYNLTPDRIAVELSPEVVKHHTEDSVVANLLSLQNKGHRLDLDGAGPDAVPLFALQRFSIDRIKLDRALVLGVETDPQKDQSVRAIVALAKAMEMQTIATGVETSNEREHLAKIGCDHLQGFGIARPIRAEEVVDWVRARDASRKPIELGNRRAS